VIRLKVDSLVGYVEKTFNLNKWKDPFYFKFSWKKTFFRQVFDFSKIKTDLVVVLAFVTLL
jgi:hypothetical protein